MNSIVIARTERLTQEGRPFANYSMILRDETDWRKSRTTYQFWMTRKQERLFHDLVLCGRSPKRDTFRRLDFLAKRPQEVPGAMLFKFACTGYILDEGAFNIFRYERGRYRRAGTAVTLSSLCLADFGFAWDKHLATSRYNAVNRTSLTPDTLRGFWVRVTRTKKGEL